MKLQKFAKTHTNLQITFADIIPKSKTSIMSKPNLAVFTKEEEKDKATIKTKDLMSFYSNIDKTSSNIKNSKEKQKRYRR